jgi:hypothetical protein
LIDFFFSIDHAREVQYQDRPATKEQEKRIRQLGGDADDLKYGEARDEIMELEGEERRKELDALPEIE